MLATLTVIEPEELPAPDPRALLVALLPAALIADAIKHYHHDRAELLRLGFAAPASFDDWLENVLRDRLYLRPAEWLVDTKGGA